jgi:hypothetical protein
MGLSRDDPFIEILSGSDFPYTKRGMSDEPVAEIRRDDTTDFGHP